MIGLAVMTNPMQFIPGIIFDTRSILLSLSGFFFGLVPTSIAVGITLLFRIYQGGGGLLMGIGVIVTSAALGLLWRRRSVRREGPPRWPEFYFFGVVVHAAMMLWMFALPQPHAWDVVSRVGPVVLLVYPVATVFLGIFLSHHRERHRIQSLVQNNERRFRKMVEQGWDILALLDGDMCFHPASDSAAAVLGYGLKAMAGNRLDRLVHQKDAGVFAETFRVVLSERNFSRKIDFRLLHQKGHWVWIEAVLTNLSHDPDIGAVVFNGRDITFRKELEESLRQSESQLRKAQAIGRMGSWEFNLNTGMVAASDEGRRIYGLGAEEWTIAEVKNIPMPEYRETLKQAMTDLVEGRQPYDVCFRIRRPDDGELVDIHSQAEYDSERHVIVGTIRDISEQRRQEKQVLESEERLTLVIKGTGAGLWDWNVQTGETVLNERWAEMLGYSLEELGPVSFRILQDLTHPEDMEKVWSMLQKHFSGELEWYETEFRMKHKCGNWKWIQDRGGVVARTKEGQPLRMTGIHIDIDARKQAEEAFQQALELNRDIISSVQEGVVVYDSDLRIVLWNPFMKKLTGLAADQVIGRKSSELFPHLLEQGLDKVLHQALMGETMYNLDVHYFSHHLGKTFWGSCTYVPRRDVWGNILGVVATIHENTDRKMAEDALRERETMLASILAASPVGIGVVRERKFSWLSRTFCDMHGYGEEELIGKEASCVYENEAEFERAGKILYDSLIIQGVGETETRCRRRDGSVMDTLVKVASLEPENPEAGITFTALDITERKQVERYQQLTTKILGILNHPGSLSNAIEQIGEQIKSVTGIEAVAIRLKDGDDFPYYYASGFSAAFLATETSLFDQEEGDRVGKGLCDQSRLACMCGKVIGGEVDPSLPFFTVNGTFWTNDVETLLGTFGEQIPLEGMRYRCLREGYRSLALIPLRAGREVIGLLQLNDLRPQMLSQESIQLFEGIAPSIGIALSRKQAGEELMENQERLQTAQKIGKIGFWQWNYRDERIWWSDGLYEIYGLEPEKFTPVRGSYLRFIHPEDRLMAKNAMKQVFENNQPYDIEYRATRQDGAEILIRSKASLIRDVNGQPLRLVGAVQDMTEQKRAEELQRASEETYRALFNATTAAVAIQNIEDFSFVDANRAFLEIYGYSIDEVKNLKPNQFCSLDEAHRCKLCEENRERLLREETVQVEVKDRRKDGTSLWMEKTIRKVNINGIDRIMVLAQDTTEKKMMQQIMIQTEKIMALGGLAAGMAHEINNPLGIISQGVQNVVRRTREKIPANLRAAEESHLSFDSLQTYLQKRNVLRSLDAIQEAAARAAGIVENMLEFSHRNENSLLPGDINQILEKAIALARIDYDLKKKYDFRNIDVLTEFGDLPKISCVASELEQVFLNLLRNSAQSLSEAGPRKPVIRVCSRGEADSAVIEIEDNGMGIPPDDQRRIFEPFFTTKKPGEGTGLGLSVSFHIVTQRHHGQMTVESEPGKWTRFRIRLPVGQKASSTWS
ncbi:MAG: PAS domain S-box protein [Syntrophaceae bacterium]|nr:PAS domain S-box protein [Syntrophaceae bacterium]